SRRAGPVRPGRAPRRLTVRSRPNSMTAMPIARANGIDIAYETLGDPADPTVLLVHGLGCQLIEWDDELCRAIVDRGFHVVRFDNRDVGESTRFDQPVDVMGVIAAVAAGEVPEVPYLLSDMAADAVGLLDHLGVDRGVAVEPFTVEAAARAALGVTGAAAAVAATGSVVLDSRRAGGRTASLLPPVHLCVVQVAALHPTPADVLRHLGDPGGGLPPSLVLVTGPSRTGDIEQLLTLGAHGPTALHVVLVLDGPGPASTRDGGARA